jgi:HAD superfamily hydrolase (TIGR01509 family)
MIRAILFDLDGVLVDADKWHFNALNVALQHSEIEPISWQEHLTIYKGIPTKEKLRILSERKGLPRDLWETISASKQEVTRDIIRKFCTPDPEKVEMMKLLSQRFTVGVCSNAIRDTVELMLERSGLAGFVHFSLSNQDVQQPKPSPAIYEKAFEHLRIKPHEAVIVEDSDVGKRAAIASRGVLCSVAGPHEVNFYRVLKTVQEAQQVNVIIPAAGQGRRFSEMGYQHPKPLIQVNGKPMIELVLENVRGLGRPIVIMQQKHTRQYCADFHLKSINPSTTLIEIDGLTEGAACTMLTARELINNQNELIMANSDQFLDFDLTDFLQKMRVSDADAGMLTFYSDHPKWSYAKVRSDGTVSEVAEKVVISNHATVGIYYYRHGSDFVHYADRMIAKNVRVNGEFYVSPVFNEYIADGKKLLIHEIDARVMHGLGTPEDLDKFLQRPRPTTIVELETELPWNVTRAKDASAPHAEATHIDTDSPGIRS